MIWTLIDENTATSESHPVVCPGTDPQVLMTWHAFRITHTLDSDGSLDALHSAYDTDLDSLLTLCHEFGCTPVQLDGLAGYWIVYAAPSV